jgi:catechol 2,3-dioxygenase-like lactoylglutathione lyase family enzyme
VPRGLDHVAHAVRDLEAAADLYMELGFTVGARNRHPWGTHNRLVQCPGFFIELLTVAEPERLGNDGLSTLFGAYHRDFIERREGLSFLVLESDDAARDAARFRAAGIAASDVLRFEREGRKPDGSPVTVAFSLAFARDDKAPDLAFAACQQHYPENFWNAALQAHANSVSGIAGVVLVADNPSDHHIFLSAFTGERDLQSTSTGVSVKTPRGDIQIMDAAAYRAHFGVAAPDPEFGPQIAALRFWVKDSAIVRARLEHAGIDSLSHLGRVVVGPQAAMGASLVFEAAG